MSRRIEPLRRPEGDVYDDAYIYVEEIPTHGQKTITIVFHTANTCVNTVFSFDAKIGDLYITRRPDEVEVRVRSPLMSVRFYLDNYVEVEGNVGYYIETANHR